MPTDETDRVTAEWLRQAERLRAFTETILTPETGPITTVAHGSHRSNGRGVPCQ